MEHTRIIFDVLDTDFAAIWKTAQDTATSLGVWGPDLAGFELVCESIQPEEIVSTMGDRTLVAMWRAQFAVENVPCDFLTVQSIRLI
jgi:hypothetical protein